MFGNIFNSLLNNNNNNKKKNNKYEDTYINTEEYTANLYKEIEQAQKNFENNKRNYNSLTQNLNDMNNNLHNAYNNALNIKCNDNNREIEIVVELPNNQNYQQQQLQQQLQQQQQLLQQQQLQQQNNYYQNKLYLEQQKLELEKEKLELEKLKFASNSKQNNNKRKNNNQSRTVNNNKRKNNNQSRNVNNNNLQICKIDIVNKDKQKILYQGKNGIIINNYLEYYSNCDTNNNSFIEKYLDCDIIYNDNNLKNNKEFYYNFNKNLNIKIPQRLIDTNIITCIRDILYKMLCYSVCSLDYKYINNAIQNNDENTIMCNYITNEKQYINQLFKNNKNIKKVLYDVIYGNLDIREKKNKIITFTNMY